MSLERAMSRGRFLKARFGVNGIQKAARSFGTSARTAGLGLAAVVIRARSFGTGVSWQRTMPAGPALVQLSPVLPVERAGPRQRRSLVDDSRGLEDACKGRRLGDNQNARER